MKIAIIGGGPAGLYAAILLKKQRPQAAITVYERNRADDTFGFGVVFSDATLDNFEKQDSPSYRRITEEFAYWDDIAVHFRGTVHRVGGNGFCGCSRRTLLLILQERARELGVTLEFETDVDDEARFSDADLVVLADGINSRFRDRYADHFQPEVDLRSNKFAWMGSTRPLDAFTFIFQETAWGPFIAHAYQYEAGRSTWIFETDAETFARAGLEGLSERESADRMAEIFGWFLEGHQAADQPLDVAKFPDDPQPALGQEATWCCSATPRRPRISRSGRAPSWRWKMPSRWPKQWRRRRPWKALCRSTSTGRREEVEKTQHAADVSLVWFEHVDRFWDFDPVQFAFGVMTRAKAITYDNLTLRAPEFVREVDKAFAKQVRANGLRCRSRQAGGADVPAAQIARDGPREPRGGVADVHVLGEGRRARRFSPGALRLARDRWCRIDLHRDDLRRPRRPHHAGLRGIVERRAAGGVDAHRRFRSCQFHRENLPAAWPCRPQGRDQIDVGRHGPAAGAGRLGYAVGIAVTLLIRTARCRARWIAPRWTASRSEFVAAALRGDACGFDMLELHCAHGYLLASFISPLTNARSDEYGGTLANRLRYPLEVFAAMRAAWPAHKPMSVRISATDWAEGGITGDDAVAIARAFGEAGVDLVDVSTGQTVRDAQPIYGRMFQTPFSEQVRNEARVATMCVGNITSADQVNTILAAGRADLVALGRPHLVDPSFTMRAAAWYGADIACPPQYLPGKEQIFRNSVRDRQDFDDLKIKGKPKTRAELKAEATKPLAAE